MDVILLQRVVKLGQMGDTVRVKNGYARNFLLPTGKALRATEANKKRFQDQKVELEARNCSSRARRAPSPRSSRARASSSSARRAKPASSTARSRRVTLPRRSAPAASRSTATRSCSCADQDARPAHSAGPPASGNRNEDHDQRRPFAGGGRAPGQGRDDQRRRGNHDPGSRPRSRRGACRGQRRRRLRRLIIASRDRGSQCRLIETARGRIDKLQLSRAWPHTSAKIFSLCGLRDGPGDLANLIPIRRNRVREGSSSDFLGQAIRRRRHGRHDLSSHRSHRADQRACLSRRRRTISRRNRRCSAPSSSTTTPSTASRTFSRPSIFPRNCTGASTSRGQLIRAGKLATPITLKTFLGEHDLGGITIPQYLARLAAEATTIINAEDYGRTIHDLAVRRDLIVIGEDIVNAAYDAPVEFGPRDQIEEAERKLYSIAESGPLRRRLPALFRRAGDRRRHGRQSLGARRTALGHRHGPHRTRQQDGRPAGLRSRHHRRPSRHGQDGARDQHRLQHRQGLSSSRRAPTARMRRSTAASSASSRSKCRPSNWRPASSPNSRASPSYKIRRGDISEAEFHRVAQAAREMQPMPFYIDQTGGISIAQLAARARRLKRQRGLDLLVVDYHAVAVGLEDAQRQPRAGTDRDHHRPQGAGQGIERADPGAVAALASGRDRATTSARSSRTCANPARSSRTPTS